MCQKNEQAKKYAEQPTVALYNSNNELVVQQTGANNEAKPWFATGLGKVADFTTKPSKPQPQAVYAAAKPSTSQFTTSVAATIPSTGAAQSNDQRLVEVWQKSSKAERQKFMAWLAEQSN